MPFEHAIREPPFIFTKTVHYIFEKLTNISNLYVNILNTRSEIVRLSSNCFCTIFC